MRSSKKRKRKVHAVESQHETTLVGTAAPKAPEADVESGQTAKRSDNNAKEQKRLGPHLKDSDHGKFVLQSKKRRNGLTDRTNTDMGLFLETLNVPSKPVTISQILVDRSRNYEDEIDGLASKSEYKPAINTRIGKDLPTNVWCLNINEEFEPYLQFGHFAEETSNGELQFGYFAEEASNCKQKTKDRQAANFMEYKSSNEEVPVYVKPIGEKKYYYAGMVRLLDYRVRDTGIDWAPNPKKPDRKRGRVLRRHFIFQIMWVERYGSDAPAKRAPVVTPQTRQRRKAAGA